MIITRVILKPPSLNASNKTGPNPAASASCSGNFQGFISSWTLPQRPCASPNSRLSEILDDFILCQMGGRTLSQLTSRETSTTWKSRNFVQARFLQLTQVASFSLVEGDQKLLKYPGLGKRF